MTDTERKLEAELAAVKELNARLDRGIRHHLADGPFKTEQELRQDWNREYGHNYRISENIGGK